MLNQKLFIYFFVVFCTIAWGENVLTEKLKSTLNNANDREYIPVLISLKENLHPETAIDILDFRESKKNVIAILQQRAQKSQHDILSRLLVLKKQNKATNIKSFWITNAIAVDLNKQAIFEMAKLSQVVQISSNAVVKLISPQLSQKNHQRFIQQTNIEFVNADVVQDLDEGYFITGFNVKVAVLDTGFSDLQTDQVFLDSNSTSFVSTEPFVNDLNFHGTHVAGIIGSRDFGVARDCTILAVKVLDRFGGGSFDDIVDGIQFAISQNAQIINMSLGATPSQETKEMETAVKNASKLGIFVVAAAGNSGPLENTIDSPGNVSEAFTVGAIGHVGFLAGNLPGLIASFSSRGPKGPDFCAPGVNIPSLALNPVNDPLLVDGTSQAAPHVAGTIALLIEAVDFLQIDEKVIAKLSKVKSVEKFLIQESSNGPAVKNVTGSGHIDALSAVNALLKLEKSITLQDIQQLKLKKLQRLRDLGRR